jgi:hypothetical protein
MKFMECMTTEAFIGFVRYAPYSHVTNTSSTLTDSPIWSDCLGMCVWLSESHKDPHRGLYDMIEVIPESG